MNLGTLIVRILLYMRLFEAIVFDVWKEQRAQLNTTCDGLKKRLDRIHERTNQLTEAFVYNQSIDRERLIKLNALAKVEERDVESAVNFALFAIGDASRFWIQASLEQKQRFQQSLFRMA